ncbi:hypothetical protein Dip510_000066 [Elusimicrobium posterum]|uniref:hypothetical protein n=1 Tax=Elusimicrobium posterum TaxID=3116653 RepID=UPI003C73DB59
MPYYNDSGFIPATFDDAMQLIMEGVNEKFKTSYTYDTFQGTNFYKFFYSLVQNGIETENIFAEIYAKYQDYIRTTNEKIAIPKTPVEGLIKTFKDVLGITLSVKQQDADNAGTLAVCAQLKEEDEDYASKKIKVLNALKDYTVAGLYYEGDQRGEAALSNGQFFEYGFYLPVYHPAQLRLEITNSRNTNLLVDSDEDIKEKVLANIKNLYGLGVDFNPERYFTVERDAPYAGKVVLKYKTPDMTEFSTDLFKASYRDLFEFDKEDIEIVVGQP